MLSELILCISEIEDLGQAFDHIEFDNRHACEAALHFYPYEFYPFQVYQIVLFSFSLSSV